MAIDVLVKLEEETCIVCGCVFAIPAALKTHLRETHTTFYCPVGHNMFYPGKSDAEKWKEKAAQAGIEVMKITRERDEVLERLAKTNRRINAGICPHCHRHFIKLERHIKMKHSSTLTTE